MHPPFTDFCQTVWDFYKKNKRPFIWRQTDDPYAIVVSEIMLQQTQTSRVEEKFISFTNAFSSFSELANASQKDVLKEWVGLGYNRRARFLHGIAQRVEEDFNGRLPDCVETLTSFKGLGHATASSIVAFTFNKPTIFIETNIRAVYLHSFFPDQEEVSDKELLPFVEMTVDEANPREWYYALMDYGVMLKKKFKNPSRKSKHHVIQSRFEGSRRQVRGAILRHLVSGSSVSKQDLLRALKFDSEVIQSVLIDLKNEGFIAVSGSRISIS